MAVQHPRSWISHGKGNIDVLASCRNRTSSGLFAINDKYIFIANQGTEEKPSNSVSKIDLATRQVVATIETGKGAHGLVVSKDNKYIFVTNMYEDTVSIIDNNTNKVSTTVKVGKTPNGISFSQPK
ncbi:YncE family protein [Desulfosporosinus fructosivorans]|uniref:YncE family protein n=1 Tax=Desulfosporosinus fructosivorans TaxID=2018669 RepID=UPI001FB09BDF|nr:YncE family protein [Desulfosporosinus fructosivorans]